MRAETLYRLTFDEQEMDSLFEIMMTVIDQGRAPAARSSTAGEGPAAWESAPISEARAREVIS